MIVLLLHRDAKMHMYMYVCICMQRNRSNKLTNQPTNQPTNDSAKRSTNPTSSVIATTTLKREKPIL